MWPILIKEGIAVLIVGGMVVMGSLNIANKPIEPMPKDMLGQWVEDTEAVELVKKYGDIPVVVKGGRNRSVFPLSEVIKNGENFEEVHPNIGWIREVWIPDEENLSIIKKQYPKHYEWYKEHLKKGWF